MSDKPMLSVERELRTLAEKACGTAKDSTEYRRFLEAVNPTVILDLTAAVTPTHTMKTVMDAVQLTRDFPMLTSNQCHALAERLNLAAGLEKSKVNSSIRTTLGEVIEMFNAVKDYARLNTHVQLPMSAMETHNLCNAIRIIGYKKVTLPEILDTRQMDGYQSPFDSGWNACVRKMEELLK